MRWALLASCMLLAACAGGGTDPSPSVAETRPEPVTTSIPPDPNAPYPVAAIDYHVHDAHPSAPVRREQALVFSNQGNNLHNVTFEGTTFSRDIRPGERLTIDPLGELLTEPGRWEFICKYHADRGMSGVIVVES